MNWFRKYDRIYLGWASIGIYWLFAAVFLWLMADTSLGQLPNWPHKSPIDSWLKYVAIVCLLLSFRANNSLLMTAHFIFAAVAMGFALFPAWGFVVLHAILAAVLGVISGIRMAIGAESGQNPIGASIAMFPVHVRTSAEAILICTLLLRLVFDQKRRYVAVSPRAEKRNAILLTVLAGLFGVHRVYYGRYRSGFLYALTLGFLGIGTFRDLIVLVQTGSLDSEPLRS